MELMKVGLGPDMETSLTAFTQPHLLHGDCTTMLPKLHNLQLFNLIQTLRCGPEGLLFITLWHMEKNSFNDNMHESLACSDRAERIGFDWV